jgi:hypothetical protein
MKVAELEEHLEDFMGRRSSFQSETTPGLYLQRSRSSATGENRRECMEQHRSDSGRLRPGRIGPDAAVQTTGSCLTLPRICTHSPRRRIDMLSDRWLRSQPAIASSDDVSDPVRSSYTPLNLFNLVRNEEVVIAVGCYSSEDSVAPGSTVTVETSQRSGLQPLRLM